MLGGARDVAWSKKEKSNREINNTRKKSRVLMKSRGTIIVAGGKFTTKRIYFISVAGAFLSVLFVHLGLPHSLSIREGLTGRSQRRERE